MNETPMFVGMEDLVKWMCQVAPREAIVRGPGFARWQKSNDRDQTFDEKPKTPRHWVELSAKPHGMDAAGQVGMLSSFFSRLPYDEYSHILARYLVPGKRTDKDSRTRSEDDAMRLWILERKQNAREFLAMLLQGQIAPEVDLRVFRILVEKFYGGERRVLNRLAKQSGLSRYRLKQLDSSVFVTLDAIAYRAEKVVYARLAEHGVLM